MKKELKSKDFLPSPEYPGGNKALVSFIDAHLKYPNSAKQQNIEGTTIVKAEINYKGDVVNTKILSSLQKDCDEEAERVVKLLKFKVSKIRSMKVSFFKTFHIHFKKSITPLPPQQVEVNYKLVPNEDILKTKNQSILSYTINLKPNSK